MSFSYCCCKQTAKTDDSHLTVGKDGKLYRFEDKKDWERYRVLTDEQLEEELHHSQEIRKNMLTISGKMKDGKVVSKKKSGSVLSSTPMFGITTKATRKDQKAWERELATAAITGKASNGNHSDVIKELLANTTKQQLEEEEDEDEEEEEEEDQDDDYQASNEQKAFQVIQKKYEQNLNVVETLYHEKINLEEYTKLLEKEIELLTGKKIVNSPFSKIETIRKKKKKTREMEEQEQEEEKEEDEEDYIDDDHHPRHSSSNIPMKQQLKQSSFEPSSIKFPSSTSSHSFSASELAALLEHLPDAKIPRNSRSKNLKSSSMDNQVKRSHSAPRWSSGSTTALNERERDPSLTRKKRSQDDSSSLHRSLISRSQSSEFSNSPSRASTTAGVSRHLQADIDRYLQKQKLLKEKENLQKLEQSKYELSLQEKRLSASMYGKEFTEMKKREEIAKQNLKNRLRRSMDKEKEEKELTKELEKEKKRLQLEKLKYELSSKSNMKWEEIKEEEDRQRKERIEKRKNELLTMSQLPKSMQDFNFQNHSRLSSDSRDNIENHHKDKDGSSQRFRAKDPTKVIEDLNRRRDQWDNKLKREREKSQERRQSLIQQQQHSQHSLGSGNGSGSGRGGIATPSMVAREAHLREKHEKSRKEREQKEAEIKRLKEEKEQEKYETLMSLKLPDSSYKLTKSEVLRQKKIYEEKQREKLVKQRELKRQYDKEMTSKENTAYLSILLRERQEKLKSRNPNYIELTPIQNDKAIREKALLAKQEYMLKLKENKEKLEEKVKQNRPSLLEREDTKIAKRNAASKALMKFGQLLTENDDNREEKGGRGGKYDNKKSSKNKDSYSDDEYEDDELFESFNKKSTATSSARATKALVDDLLDPIEQLKAGIK
jgi:hypothetical protein